MSLAYQELCALCRLANYGLDTISATTPEIKALKAAAKKELVNIARVIATAPKDKLHRPANENYYYSRAAFSRNEFGDYDDDEEARACEVMWIVDDIKRGLGNGYYGAELPKQVDETPFVQLWVCFGEDRWNEEFDRARAEISAGRI